VLSGFGVLDEHGWFPKLGAGKGNKLGVLLVCSYTHIPTYLTRESISKGVVRDRVQNVGQGSIWPCEMSI
jgi:hypothetical protein